MTPPPTRRRRRGHALVPAGTALALAALAAVGHAAAGSAPAAAVMAPAAVTAPAVACEGGGEGGLCEDFEAQTGTEPSGRWAATAPNCSGTGSASVDSSVAHSGSKSVRIDGGAGYCNHIFVGTSLSDVQTGSTMYTRFWVRHTTDLPAAHVTFLAMDDANDGDKDLRMGGQNGALQWNRESDDATLPEQSPNGVELSLPLALNTWTCVEYGLDGSAGLLETWVDGATVEGLVVDGTPTHDIDGQWLNRSGWRPAPTDLRLGWESYGSGADTLWFDDVAVSSSRIGC